MPVEAKQADGKRMFMDIGAGDALVFDDGRVRVTLEEKTGRRARLKIELVGGATVEKVAAPKAVQPHPARFGIRGLG